MANVNRVETLLRERLDQITRRVGRIEGDLRSAHDRDWPERASELANDDVLEGLDEIGRAEFAADSRGVASNRERQLRHLFPVRAADQRRAPVGNSNGRDLHRVCALGMSAPALSVQPRCSNLGGGFNRSPSCTSR